MDFLVIDDDKTFRDATCFLIEDAGHYAAGVGSGQLGLNWLKEDKWDAVLLDLNLGAVILAKREQIFPEDFPAELRSAATNADAGGGALSQVGSLISLEQLEEAHLRRILGQTASLTEAAEIPGIDQATLYRKRKKIGLG